MLNVETCPLYNDRKTMKLLKIGISGVRGIVGESVTPKLVMDFASAFGAYVGRKPVFLARDTRIHGPMLRSACASAKMRYCSTRLLSARNSSSFK